MKSTFKVHDVLGCLFITGTVSIEDFKLHVEPKVAGKIDHDNPRSWCAMVKKSRIGSGFKYTNAGYSCNYELPEELVKEISRVHALRDSFGNYGELNHLGRRLFYSFETTVSDCRKEKNAQKQCDEVNAKLERWLVEDRDEYVRECLQSMINDLQIICDKVNTKSAICLADHKIKHICDNDEDKILINLQAQIKATKKKLDDLEEAELSRCKELTLAWVDGLDIPNEHKQLVQDRIGACKTLYNEICIRK